MLTIRDIRTEYRKNPLGMDDVHPRFSYKLEGDSTGQSARRILVKSEHGETVWDSGTVKSKSTVQIEYSGDGLKPFTRYFITVTSIDESGCAFASSGDDFFETGFLGSAWTAKWIRGRHGAAVMGSTHNFRKEFEARGSIAKARLYVSALGLYEAFLNGRRVSDNIFTPGWTDYYNRVQYQAYDVTEMISGSDVNCLALRLANGWYCGVCSKQWHEGRPTYGEFPAVIAMLRITLQNGETYEIGTDDKFSLASYEGHESALRMSDIYMGETYEAFREDEKWKYPHYNDTGWAPAPLIVNPNVSIVWHRGANVRRTQELSPVSVTRRPNGAYIVDFGQNLAGRERFTLKNTQTGLTIVIKHGEMLRSDGSLYTENLRTAAATTTYTTGAHTVEVYEPIFAFYGFRYLEISGWPGELNPDDIKAEVIHSDLPFTGSFECSDPLLNKLYSNIVWGNRSNFLDIPTDCPQRDERYGWTGDTQVFINTATYNMFAAEFYRKWIEDLNLNLDQQGCFTDYVPDPYIGDRPTTAWADAGIICPWTMFLKYADMRVLSDNYENMAHWIDWQIKNAGGLIVDNSKYGDWLNINAPISNRFLCTAYLAGMTRLLSKIARIIGKTEEAESRENLASRIKNAFIAEFFSNDGEISEKSQTAMLLALHFDLVPDNAVSKTVEELLHDITVTRKNHLSTGFVGTPLLMGVLEKFGYIEEAYSLLKQTTYPGWLYPVTQGATTMWERWNSWSDTKGFGDTGMNSFNHYAYGAVAEWFYESICGIRPDEEAPAFAKFILAPHPGGGLSRAKASFESFSGLIESSWETKDNRVYKWEFAVPCNTSARIVIPEGFSVTGGAEVLENETVGPGHHSLILERI